MALADERTLEALDFPSVRAQVVAATRTERGRAAAVELAPHRAFDRVVAEQARTQAVRSLLSGEDFYVMTAIDTAPFTQTAALGRSLSAADLRAVGDAVAAAAAAWKAAHEHRDLAQLTAPYVPLRDLQHAIGDAIDERANVLDRASPALGRIRRGLARAQTDARDRISAILQSAKYAKVIQDRVVTIREGRFVVPIKAEFSGALPGIVHDTSSSGQTLFVEPLAALETNNRVRTLQIDEEREVARVLSELSRRVGGHADAIEANVDMLAALDLLAAKAAIARRTDAIEPQLCDDASVSIERGRHPLLGERAVPQTVALGEATQIVVVSGPNMGGKTVALKMLGLFVVMAYCGLQLPAGAGTTIGRFDRVIADIGDEQSLATNASTFSAHLQRMREILDAADGRTLAIVDEIGGGTEPSAGAALAIAMLERLRGEGARAIVSTHATELKLFAHATAGIANANVRFDPQTFAPTFDLDVGSPGQSLAFPLARRLGFDEPLLERAGALLDERERDYEAALSELAAQASALREERAHVEHERREAGRDLERVAREAAALEQERRAFGERGEERLRAAMRDFVRELQRRAADSQDASQRRLKGKVSSSQAALLAETVEAMRRDLGIGAKPATPADELGFAPGDRVRVLSFDQEGTVGEDFGERVLVRIGSMRAVVEKTDLRRERPAPAVRGDRGTRAGEARLNAAERSTLELDVRGRRYAEAEPLVERWLDDAQLAGVSSLRLIHGKGTGMLGRGLQEYLRAHPAVSSLRYGHEDEGSTGVTVVELRA